MRLHPTQDLVGRDKSLYRVVNCGRQWGKTTLAAWEMLAFAYFRNDSIVKYFATTIDQARDIAWAMLKSYAGALVVQANESRLELIIRTKDKGTSKIKLGGYENIETERGKQNDFLVLDEVAQMRNFNYTWEAILEPTLLFRHGQALFISTPRGFNHFHKMYMRGQNGEENWRSWSFSSYDNPFLDKRWLDTRREQTTPEFFSQEYLAEFTRFTGLIYPEFDSSRHVHYFDHEKNQHGDYIFGLDFAVRGYTAALVSYIDIHGHIYHLDEYKRDGLTAQEHAKNIKEILTKYADFDKWTGYADPAGWMKNQQKKDMIWAIADEYLEDDFPIVPANNEVIGGINFVKQLHRQDKIHIHPRCTMYVEEKFQYQWKEQSKAHIGVEDEPEKVRKINDHILDCERYEVYSKPEPAEEQPVHRDTVMPITFPPPQIDNKGDKEEDKYEKLEIPSLYEN